MKNFIFSIALIVSSHVSGQGSLERVDIFLRVYDLEGKKVAKGKLLAATDSTIEIYTKQKSETVLLNNIGSVKTKRSAGNNLWMGTAIGATSMAMGMAATANPNDAIFDYTATEGAVMGAVMGGIFGAIVGGATIAFKKSQVFKINADPTKWTSFIQAL